MEPTDAAYLAGIIDGEGCICVVRNSVASDNCFMTVISVTNTSLRMLEHLLDVTGTGSIVFNNRREGRKTSYRWQVSTKDLQRVLETALPYLVVKGEQASLALELIAMRAEAKQAGKRAVLPQARARRWEIYHRVRELNRKAIDVPLEPGQRERVSEQPYRGRRRTSEEEEAKIVALLQQPEMTTVRVAELVGVSRTVVRRVANQNEIATPYPTGNRHWLKQREETGEGLRSAECARCGKAFQTTHPKQRFCGVQCQQSWHNERQSEARKQRRQQNAVS